MDIHIDKNKPLLIQGKSGSGKTHIALELSKDMVLTKIDSSMLKSIKNKDYLLNIVKKRNITLMFSEKKEQRCLLIDDIHIFQKHDKSFFKTIIDFIKECKYYHTFIVMTCNISLLKKKDINMIKKYIDIYEIKYTYSQYYKICLKISQIENYNLSLDELDKKIYLSEYNLNTFKSDINNIKTNDQRDNFDPIGLVTKNLIENNYCNEELFRLCEGDELILSYNMLENLNKIIKVNIKKYNNIYKSFVNSDIIEYNLLKNDKDCVKYMSIVSISFINYYKDMICRNIISNRYISKSMVLTNSINIKYLHFKLYLYNSYIKYKDTNYKDKLFKIDKKEYDKIKKIYDILCIY